jgi:hypothetical protein
MHYRKFYRVCVLFVKTTKLPQGEYVGTLNQVKYISNAAYGMPSGDDYAVLASEGEGFLRESVQMVQGKSETRLVFCSDKGLQALFAWGSVVYMDGTSMSFLTTP